MTSKQSDTARRPRVWVVTGSSSGFGHAPTVAAITAGDVVVATARDPDRLEAVVAGAPGRVEAPQLDVTDVAGPRATHAATL